MRNKLPKEIVNQLINLPESGIGYHEIDVLLKNGEVIEGVLVYNCEETSSLTKSDIEQIESIILTEDKILNEEIKQEFAYK